MSRAPRGTSGGHTLGRMYPIPALFALHGGGPFVGRAEQLSALTAGGSPVVLVTGEAGVGKSRLVAEWVTAAAATVVVAHCDDLREPQPLGPVFDGLRAAWTAGLVDVVVPAAVPALPDQDAERARLLRSTARLLGSLGPLVLAVEDLQMADPATLELIDHLAAYPVPGLTVLITMRDGEWPGGWRPSATVGRLRVPAMTPDEVGHLAAGLLDTDLSVADAARLHERTAGIPFLVEEVVRSDPSLRSEGPVPALLRDVLLARLRPLDEVAREVLGAAAVAGNAVDPLVLGAMLGLSGAVVGDALATALSAGLLHERDGRMWFRHTLARQVVHELVPPLTRQMLHLRTARMLERQRPRPVARLAHHYREAGSPADHVRNASAAADLASAQGDDATAARFLLGAIGYDGLPRPVRVRLAAKLGRSAIEGVAQTEAIPVLRSLLADRRLPPGSRGELGFALGRMLRQQGEARLGYEEIERAVPYLRNAGRRARALAVLSAPDTVVGLHVSQHQEHCLAAARAAAESGEASARLAVEIARLSLALETLEPGAWAAVRSALEDLSTHPRERARAALNWAQGALHVGLTSVAASLLDIGRRLVDAAEYERLRPLVELTEMSLDLAADRRAGLADRLLRFLARPHRLPLAMADARLHLARLHHREGRMSLAEEGMREVIAEADRVGAIWPLVPARTALAALLVELPGRVSEGRTEAERVLDLVAGKGLPAWGQEAARLLLD
jgi:hypothetical protein